MNELYKQQRNEVIYYWPEPFYKGLMRTFITCCTN